jgi:hypothetical protein
VASTTSRTLAHPSGTATTTTAPGTPPVRVLLFGDSEALTLGLGLANHADQAKYGYRLSDKGILGCGVVDGPEVEQLGTLYSTSAACDGSAYNPDEPPNDQPWPYQWRSAIAMVHPNVAMLLAGRWEVVNREYQGQWTNILHPEFAAYVKSQLEKASNLVTATGTRMVFLTAPCTDEGEQPNGAPWPEDSAARLSVYNRLVREVAAEHPQTDSVVDLDGAACPRGKYTASLDGVAARWSDGIHFTIAGGRLLAPVLMPPIVAAGRAQMSGITSNPATTTPTTSAG